jgi:pyridoxal phosphate enzyme (YggS family)
MDKERENKLKLNYEKVLDGVKKSVNLSEHKNKNTVLIAVSKKRAWEDIKVIYDQGHRIFGENYPQELIEKSKKLPKDIEWHLIGHLQSNKVKKLLDEIPNVVIESVDRLDIVEKINKYASEKNKTKVYIEINISEEPSKTGCNQKDIFAIAEEIVKKSPRLELVGIMSLGNVGNKKEFEKMLKIKDELCEKYSLNKENFIASFGTSQDYEEAILCGSDEVRVGHQIFEV